MAGNAPSICPEDTISRTKIAADLARLLPSLEIISDDAGLRPYECDGLMAFRQMPLLAVLPQTRDEVGKILRYCNDNRVKIVPRGAGTSLSGGALPLADGILMSMMKFNQILEIDYDNRIVVAQPGVTNLAVTEAVADRGFYYAPDPSSQIACSIGGNIAENSGGVHCLKYGLTTNNVLGAEIVLINGDVIRLGGRHLDSGSYDLLALISGSEGLLGVVTEITLRILPRPEMARAALIGFASVSEGGNCVAEIIAEGIIPAGMEMMDNPAINAAEDFVEAGYPRAAAALLIVELDGPDVEIDELFNRISSIAKRNNATLFRISESDEERLNFWAGRKAAFPAIGRISPDYMCMDGTIPRARLAETLGQITILAQRHGLRVANVFHAGDGNLHPLILYDANREGDLERAEAFGADILRLCVSVGGALTGEHGVGVEKRELMLEMFSQADLDQQMRIKCAFDPQHLLNPGKVFPVLRRCAELGKMHVHKGQLPMPHIPRF